VLIAMYRLPQASATWQAMTKEKIEAAAQGFRAMVSDRKGAADEARHESGEDDALFVYAIACNQYAWLVGNTFGDYAEAVKLSTEAVKISQQLLELKPNHAGFLDTLGRCCYAAGDLPGAIKNQSLAARLNPDSGQIRRQLDFFKKEAAQRGIALPTEGDAPAPQKEAVPAATGQRAP
jgi:tetratricopeptide (TPR) repeat protein